MAYDPNDPADKKIVADAVAAAVAEANDEHETAVAGLKAKNKTLLAKLAKANENDGTGDSAEVARLENELETSQKALKVAEKALKVANTSLEETTASRDAELAANRKLIVDNGLTDALTKANVAPALLDAARALHASSVVIKEDNGVRKAVVGGKDLGSYIAEWAQGDQGKHFVAAGNNGGGGAEGGFRTNANGGKTITRSAYEAAAAKGQGAAALANGVTVVDD